MEGFLNVTRNLFLPNRHPTTLAHNSLHTFKQNISDVMWAEQEIDLAFTVFGNEQYDDAVAICEAIHTNTINIRSEYDKECIKNKLFEVALEIALAGVETGDFSANTTVAKRILHIVDSNPETVYATGIIFHLESNVFKTALVSNPMQENSDMMKTCLERIIPLKKYLKCAPYFLGKVYERGLYRFPQDDEKARMYLQMAAERGYKPRNFIPLKKPGEEYQLMMAAQKINESIFSLVPTELISHISRLRVEATLTPSSRKNLTVLFD